MKILPYLLTFWPLLNLLLFKPTVCSYVYIELVSHIFIFIELALLEIFCSNKLQELHTTRFSSNNSMIFKLFCKFQKNIFLTCDGSKKPTVVKNGNAYHLGCLINVLRG